MTGMSQQRRVSSDIMGKAAEVRYSSTKISSSLRTELNQIVHSADTTGPFASKPNPYRGPTNYDSKASQAVDMAHKQAGSK
jgi:hypothetical protein